MKKVVVASGNPVKIQATLNAFSRMKMTLCADRPHLEPYDQDAWAATPDSPWWLSIMHIRPTHWRALCMQSGPTLMADWCVFLVAVVTGIRVNGHKWVVQRSCWPITYL